MVFLPFVPRPLAAPVNPWSGALQVAENSAEIGLPEAAQCARRGQALPRGWPEIEERAERVKEMGSCLMRHPEMAGSKQAGTKSPV